MTDAPRTFVRALAHSDERNLREAWRRIKAMGAEQAARRRQKRFVFSVDRVIFMPHSFWR
jgi:hypothetical protein